MNFSQRLKSKHMSDMPAWAKLRTGFDFALGER